MKHLFLVILTLVSTISLAQTEALKKKQLLAEQKSNDFVYQANELTGDNEFVSAEMAYRKAISESPSTVAGNYNLGNSYYNKGIYEEALQRHQQAAKNSTSRSEKHKAFHNIGNILMKNKKCKEAVEAYKNALRNNPKDDESRYNLALAKECAKQEGDGDGEDD
jgi:Tfp pilus assembly protein PilF